MTERAVISAIEKNNGIRATSALLGYWELSILDGEKQYGPHYQSKEAFEGKVSLNPFEDF